MNTDDMAYLGDSVYARFDGYMVVLVANPNSDAQAVVYLEPSAYAALKQYAEPLIGEGR
jgi:hypothetical protein